MVKKKYLPNLNDQISNVSEILKLQDLQMHLAKTENNFFSSYASSYPCMIPGMYKEKSTNPLSTNLTTFLYTFLSVKGILSLSLGVLN